MSIVTKVEDNCKYEEEYITDVLKNLKYLVHDKYNNVYEEYRLKLQELNKEFYFKHNVKIFNFIEDNVIRNIMRYLELSDVIRFGLVSKRNLTLMKQHSVPNMVLLNFGEHHLIKVFQNIRFWFDYSRGRKTLREAKKYEGAYSYTIMNYPNKYVDFLKSSNVVNLSRSWYLRDLSPVKNAEILILRDIHYWTMSIDNIDRLLLGLSGNNIQYLDLSHTSVTNVGLKPLYNIKKLILSSCRKLSSVENIKDVESLDISNCFNINDISMLKNIKKLSIYGCNQLRDKPYLKEPLKYFKKLEYFMDSVGHVHGDVDKGFGYYSECDLKSLYVKSNI